MSYKVKSPLVVVAPSGKSDDLGDANNGPRYFYDGAIIPDGFNDKRCDELVKDGMLEKVEASKADGPSPDSVEGILADVGEDKEKAQAALDAEQAKEKPRSSLVGKLESILGKA